MRCPICPHRPHMRSRNDLQHHHEKIHVEGLHARRYKERKGAPNTVASPIVEGVLSGKQKTEGRTDPS